MAKHDSTELLAVSASVESNDTVDPSGASRLGLIQLEALRTVFGRRVTAAVASIPDVTRHREAIILSHGRIGAGLLAKFDVEGVEHIRSNQFNAAHQFLESFALDFGPVAKLRA